MFPHLELLDSRITFVSEPFDAGLLSFLEEEGGEKDGYDDDPEDTKEGGVFTTVVPPDHEDMA